RPGAGRGEPRGLAVRPTGAAVADRVQAAPLPDDQRRAGAVQGPDPGLRLELRLPRRLRHRRVIRLVPAPQGRRGRAAADPHHPERRLRPAAARPLAPRPPLRVKLIVAGLALVAVALVLIGLASVAAVDGLLVGRLDGELQQEARGAAGRARPARPRPARGGGPGPGGGPRSPYLVQYRDADGHRQQELSNELLQAGQRPPRVRGGPARGGG